MTGNNASHVLGWISMACWIIVYSPQILENYQLKSGEGLSVPFVVIWLIADLCNLTGALMAGLIPTVIIIAIYYTICDIILLAQVYYYRWCMRERQRELSESAPLLGHEDGVSEKKVVSGRRQIFQFAAALAFVIAIGISAWQLGPESQDQDGTGVSEEPVSWTIQIIGWTSAVLYLAARIPQIKKNMTTKCEGLSPALFGFAILGNVTYSASICAKSMDHDYLIKNGSWLAGSALTVFLDIIVLGQFAYYLSQGPRREEEEGERGQPPELQTR